MFPDDDDPTYDSPIDGLAGGLDTLVTSEYNYARHLRDLCLDTLSAGDKAEASYKPYLYTTSCGKFLNTLLLLTLRKAKALDSFRWNIRVELSRPVYKALHQIASLKHLRIRMPSGPSLYETPPPLPSPWGSANGHHITPIPPHGGPMPTLTGVPQGGVTIQSLVAGQFVYNPPTFPVPLPMPSAAAPKQPAKLRPPAKKQESGEEPPTLSGFKNLETLAVLDIDVLDDVSEIRACVQNSASKLKKLKLSFSDSLASQARKPCLADPNESDDDDEFQVVPMNSYDDGSGPAKAFRAQEERKAQEAVLGRILGVEPCVVAKASQKEDKSPVAEEASSSNPAEDYYNQMCKISRRLLAHVNGTMDFSDSEDVLETILQASRRYTEFVQSKNLEASSPALEGTKEDETPTTQPASETTTFTKAFAHGHAKEGKADPEDIDVAAPEVAELVVEPQEEGSAESTAKDDVSSADTRAVTPDSSSSSSAGDNPKAAQPPQGSTTPHKVHFDLPGSAPKTDAEAEKLKLHEMNMVEAEIEDANEENKSQSSDDKEELRRQILDYKRGTRGIALESLSLHLIPTKASVLGRAIDLRSLKRLTLLNVGNQAPIWNLLAKENKLQPLPLSRIFTDHVSLSFLHLVAKLDCVHELFLLERGSKYKPESFAPKSKINLEQIRKFALRKHMHTLKYLVIRNCENDLWDLDIKTVQLICRQGKELEELGVLMGIRAVVGLLSTLISQQKLTLAFQHAFTQYMSNLARLRALHIISFRNEDTCVSVVRETRQFIVDTMSQHPGLPLEWISMGEADRDRAERIIRHPDINDHDGRAKRKKTKSKGKEVMTFPDDNYPYLHVPDESESDDDDDDQFRLKLELESPIPFWEVYGVRIWEKEVLAGRL